MKQVKINEEVWWRAKIAAANAKISLPKWVESLIVIALEKIESKQKGK